MSERKRTDRGRAASLREEPAVWDPPSRELSDEEIDATFEAAVMTPEEAWERFDEEARFWLSMSGEEFKRRWDAGELDVDGPDHTRIISVWFSMPGAR